MLKYIVITSNEKESPFSLGFVWMCVLSGVSVCVCVFDTIIIFMQNKSVCLYCGSSVCMLVLFIILIFYISYTPT